MNTFARSLSFLVLLSILSQTYLMSIAARKTKNLFYPSTDCSSENYLCKNGKCISKTWYCDGENDCGDDSDEEYCRYYNYCPSHYEFTKCQYKCIPKLWECDGVLDCSNGEDESKCLNSLEMMLTGVTGATSKAEQWLLRQSNHKSPTNKWGPDVPRIAVALFFFKPTFLSENGMTGNTITYEVYQRLLNAFLREEMDIDNLSSNDLALYINALTVSCTNARDFYGMDLVKRLSDQVDQTLDYVSPAVLLTLCNSGQDLSEEQINKLYAFFGRRSTRTDKLAFALMALSCVADKGDILRVPFSNLTSLMAEVLRSKLQQNDDFKDVSTTALVLQALIASGEDQADSIGSENIFRDTVKSLIQSQSSDGSFGSLLDMYYIIPVLRYKSFLDINSAHCNFTADKSKNGIREIAEKATNIHVVYSIAIGDDFNEIHTMVLRVPNKSNFFDIMKIASSTDRKFRFNHVLHGFRPRIYKLNGLQDDPERESYWFLFKGNQSASVHIDSSPADVIIQEGGESFMMWYRSPYFLLKGENSTDLQMK